MIIGTEKDGTYNFQYIDLIHMVLLLTLIAGPPLRHPLPPSQRQKRRDIHRSELSDFKGDSRSLQTEELYHVNRDARTP